MALRMPRLRAPDIDGRTVAGIALAALAAATVLFITRPETTQSVLVAGADLPAGTPLAELPLAVRETEDTAGLVVGTEVGELSEWSLRVPLAAGEPLLPSLLQPPQIASAPNLLALELDASHAVLGRLAGGDLVDVYATSRGGFGDEATTELVATGVYVVEARLDDRGMSEDRVSLLVAVDGELAARLAAAARSGDLDIVRVGP